jgi:hypothetical protein
MATLIAYQDGDWTGATTWKSTVLTQATRTAATTLSSSYNYSPAFTIPNGTVVEGVVIALRSALNTLDSSTISVALSDDNGVTGARTVTFNKLDTVVNPVNTVSLIYVKFDSPITGDGGNDYRLGLRAFGSNDIAALRDATASNWFRLFVESTTATPASTDELYICGLTENTTGVTPVTVTMNNTNTTSFGAVRVGTGGVLSFGTSASTNYYLRLAGNLETYAFGTLNIGTSGDRIPSTSTAVLQFNNASNVQFGLEALNGSTVNIYGAQKGSTKVLLTADCNSGQADITVEDTTGWANGDEIAVASTTRTASQSEKRTISSVTSGTTATVTSNFSFTHQGTAPYQGEVINLTRNVKVHGTSATLQSYVNCAATSNVTFDNCEFFWLGSGTANKRGIDSATTSAGTFTLKDCALRDLAVTNSVGLNTTGTSGSPTMDGCVGYNHFGTTIGVTSGIPTISDNWLILAGSLTLNDVGGTITGNRVMGTGAIGFVLTENAPLGTFNNNTAHSNQAALGINISGTGMSGTISNITVWRSNASGISINSPLRVSNLNAYHNTNANIVCGNDVKVIDSTFNGGTGQSLSASNRHVDVNGSDIVFENCDFGQTNQATSFVNVSLAGGDATFIDCNIAESLTPLTQSNLFSPTSTPTIGIDKLNGTSGSHRAYKQFGFSASDQSVYRTASPSEQLNPNDASGKLPSGSKKFGVANGNDATVSVWVRKSATYNGNEPRLIVKRNVIAGITTDTVLATASGGTDEWLELTGTTATVSDDCVLEVYVDCDGTAGVVNVDDWSIT